MSASFHSADSNGDNRQPRKRSTKLAELYAEITRDETARALAGVDPSVRLPRGSRNVSDEEWNQKIEARRAALDRLSSVQSQKEIYGVNAWDNNFQLIETLERILPNGKAAVAKLFNDDYWNDSTQRFQRLFTNRAHYIVPGVLVHVDSPGVPVDLRASATWKEAEKKCLRFEIKSTFERATMHCLGCFVDVDRIPTNLARDLGLITWQRGQLRDHLEVLAKLKNDTVALQLKLIYQSLEWIDGERRVGIVVKPKPETLEFFREKLSASRPDLLDALVIPEVALGKVIYISERDSGQTTKARRNKKELLEAPLKMQVYSSIYACRRASLHSSGTYKKELKDISEPLGRIRQFRARLDSDWRRGASQEVKEQLKKDLQDLITDIAPTFQRAQNVNKRKVKELLVKIEQSLIDDYGVTPVAKSAQLKAAETNLAVRGRESNRKHSYRTRDGGALQTTIDEWQGVFDEFSSQLRAMKQHLRPRPAFGGPRYSSEEKEQDKKRLTKELTLAVHEFEKIPALTLSTFIKKLVEAREGLAGAIQSGQRNQVERVLIRMDLICRLQKAQEAFETIKLLTMRNSGVTVGDLKEVAVSLERSLPDIPTFGKKTYRDLFSKYDKLRADAKAIRDRLDEYENKPLTLSQREEMTERLREYVKSFDLAEDLDSIR